KHPKPNNSEPSRTFYQERPASEGGRCKTLLVSTLDCPKPQKPCIFSPDLLLTTEHLELLQTRRRFGGRQPLCGTGVTSRMTTMCNPAAASARIADSRPDPGPLTFTSTLFIPYWSRAVPAADKEACCAAYGVPLRDPLNPIAPADDAHNTRPSGSAIVICVLLKEAATCTMPCGTMRFSRFFLNSFLRLLAAAGFAGAADASGTAFFCSFATFCSVTLRSVK